jgi:hypothetical protein
VQDGDDGSRILAGQRITDRRSFPPRRDQLQRFQFRQVLRDIGLRCIGQIGKLADRARALAQRAQDRQAILVRHHAQELGRLRRAGAKIRHGRLYIHTCVYNDIIIYSQANEVMDDSLCGNRAEERQI